ncbi:hypothetical protein BT67DRAFT_441692 [Trichocladium antarcticum]|uniref:Uncharacterized protein n=1 Tax=Trichocladium antarcticum TaxID=1450529 RepID=A0AAN6UK58_9PEZI|nr:hypothetical protein BT67DRAFT_441692 [Trichocladium antarcticum]
MRPDLVDSLPRPTALLFLSGILELTYAHVIQPASRPAQAATTTIPSRALNVVSWPLRPTPPPRDHIALRRQDLGADNTICGYIGGDSALPATCGSGSHCALDTEHNVVGCCPNGIDSCTDGVFTGCVDANSGPQTEANPYVYSCSGAAVCYKNIFDGGFSQFGCGTASDQATSVLASATGITSLLSRPTIAVSYTQRITTLSEPTTLGTITSPSASGTSSTSGTTMTNASPSSTEPAQAANPTATQSTTASGASPTTQSTYRTGAIVGGVVGGLAVLFAVVAFLWLLLRRRNANTREGPGLGGVRGKHISSPMGIGGGSGFAALAQESHDAFDTGPGTSGLSQNPPPAMAMKNETPSLVNPAAAASHSLLPPIATQPPMPFQSEISPIAEDPELDQERSPFAYSGRGNGGAISSASVSSYRPSSSEGPSAAGASYHYPGQYPAADADAAAAAAADGVGTGAGTGAGMMTMGRVGQERLESDQVPLTREIDDFSQGFSAALGRIGEEDEDQVAYRDHEPGAAAADSAATAGVAGGAVAGEAPAQGQGSETGSTRDSNGPMRPLWQQNRRQSRNLMWM